MFTSLELVKAEQALTAARAHYDATDSLINSLNGTKKKALLRLAYKAHMNNTLRLQEARETY